MLLLAALSGVGALIAWATFEPPEVDAAADVPRGQAMADMIVDSFLSGEQYDLPQLDEVNFAPQDPVAHATDARWDRFERFFIGDTEVEEHVYLLHRQVPGEPSSADPEPADELELTELTVLVSVADGAVPAVAALPYLQPVRDSAPQGVADYSDFDNAEQVPGEAAERLGRWAQAWARDDHDDLRVLTGDSTTGVRYVGLGQHTATNVRVIQALDTGEDRWLVRVRVSLESANGSQVDMDLDVTISDAAGNPRIDGWGPAGAGLLDPADVRITQ